MKKTQFFTGLSWLFASIAIVMAILWLLREIELIQFERPEDMVTPMLASALIGLLIGIYRKGTAE